MTNDLPKRKVPTHFPVRERFNRTNIIFLTVCSEKKKPILANAKIHRLLIGSWAQANDWLVGRYVIMPDHIHLFCSPGQYDYPPLGKWVQYWKSLTSRAWPTPEEQPVWQKSYWDTQLRRGQSYSEKWAYVCDNPVRHGLVEKVNQWPYQGELHKLFWHD